MKCREIAACIYIGPWKVKPNVIFEIQIVKSSFNMLGIELGLDILECKKTNFTDKIAKMTTKLNMEKYLSRNPVSQAQRQVDKYIWSGRTVKVKHNTLIGNYIVWLEFVPQT